MASIRDVDIIDVKKRLFPSKHYVYLIVVYYDDSTASFIRRRYSQFFNLQCELLNNFPNEGGNSKTEDRIIPFLPGKILFGRSHVKRIALKRWKPLEDYCKALITLPAELSKSEIILNFFRPLKSDICPESQNSNENANATISSISHPHSPEELTVMDYYQAKSDKELSLEKGMRVEAIEKTESGWWFVKLDDRFGWVPSTLLERKHHGIAQFSERSSKFDRYDYYVATDAYVAKNRDELSFLRGAVLEITSKNENGWWIASCKGRQGLVPCVFLKKYERSVIAKTEKSEKNITASQIDSEKSQLYKVIANFKPDSAGCVELRCGESVKVLEEDASGWWYLSIKEKNGWAPSTYLEKVRK